MELSCRAYIYIYFSARYTLKLPKLSSCRKKIKKIIIKNFKNFLEIG